MCSVTWAMKYSSQPDVRMPEVNPVRELGAADPHVQFDEREVKTGLLFVGVAPPLDSTLGAGHLCLIPIDIVVNR